MFTEAPGPVPEKEMEAVISAVSHLFTVFAQRLELEARRLFVGGLQSGALKPKFVMENGSITAAVTVPNGEEIKLFQRMGPQAIHHGLQN